MWLIIYSKLRKAEQHHSSIQFTYFICCIWGVWLYQNKNCLCSNNYSAGTPEKKIVCWKNTYPLLLSFPPISDFWDEEATHLHLVGHACCTLAKILKMDKLLTSIITNIPLVLFENNNCEIMKISTQILHHIYIWHAMLKVVKVLQFKWRPRSVKFFWNSFNIWNIFQGGIFYMQLCCFDLLFGPYDPAWSLIDVFSNLKCCAEKILVWLNTLSLAPGLFRECRWNCTMSGYPFFNKQGLSWSSCK